MAVKARTRKKPEPPKLSWENTLLMGMLLCGYLWGMYALLTYATERLLS